MHQSLASLDKDEDDDDMISVVIGDRRGNVSHYNVTQFILIL